MLVTTSPKKRSKKIPETLVYEVLNGRPLYRKGYKEVLRKNLNPENIMGSSSLQSILVTLLSSYLFFKLDENYLVASNEAGLHIQPNENLSNDIAIYWGADVAMLNDRYFSTPPRIVIEVDVKIELEEFTAEQEYIFEKTARLLSFGVEKVIWILTKTHKIIIADKGNPTWLITDWLQEISVTPDCSFVLNELLKSKKVTQPYAI
jgi:Uma2 family endonuclease